MSHKSSQRSADSIAEDFQTSTGMNISTATGQCELHGMGFHGGTSVVVK